MRVIVYDETKDAMQDARWCYVPTDQSGRAAPTYTTLYIFLGAGASAAIYIYCLRYRNV